MFNDISGKWEKIYQNIFKIIKHGNITSNDELNWKEINCIVSKWYHCKI
jgi:hypothetical protein